MGEEAVIIGLQTADHYLHACSDYVNALIHQYSIMRKCLTCVQSRTWLFFMKTHFALYSPLSLNILREICYFFGSRIFPYICHDSLYLYDLEERNLQRSTLPRSFTMSAVFCSITESEIFSVEGARQEVWTVELNGCSLTRQGDLLEHREWPGIVHFGSCVFIFGGNTVNTLPSAEKYTIGSNQWSALPNMFSPRVAFCPVVVGEAIYLCCPDKIESQIEVFSPKTETYQQLPVSFQATMLGCVSFLKDETLYIVTYDQHLTRWKLNREKVSAQEVKLLNSNSALSNTPPKHFKDCVYWCCYLNGQLVQFDVAANKITEQT